MSTRYFPISNFVCFTFDEFLNSLYFILHFWLFYNCTYPGNNWNSWSLSYYFTCQAENELTFKDLYEKEKILTDHLIVEKELLKEQYIKVWFQKLNDKFLIVQISSDFHRILRKHDRFFSHIEGEIQQLKRFHGSTIYLHN